MKEAQHLIVMGIRYILPEIINYHVVKDEMWEVFQPWGYIVQYF